MNFLKQYWVYLLTAVCAGLILWTGVVYNQPAIRMIPLFISLIVGVLMSGASRYAPLVGSMNCLLYTYVYLSLRLYANAANAFLVGFPIQLITFLRWKKRAYKNSTQFRKMGTVQWLITLGIFAAAFIGSNLILSAIGGGYQLWDTTASLLDVLSNTLRMFSFREYSWIMPFSGCGSIALNVSMLREHPGQITFVIYAVHSFFCIITQFFRVRKLCKEQEELL